MRILIAWGSKRGGTEGIARMLAHELEAQGHQVIPRDADSPVRIADADAVILGGALYANRWHRAARRFATRNAAALRTVPTWFFSSGPLDESAAHAEIAPTREVATLMERVGAIGHRTFGGRLASDAHGFPASAMAKKHAGDWRDPIAIRAWADTLDRALPFAKPNVAVAPPGGSFARLALHGFAGWAASAGALLGLTAVLPLRAALVAHLILAPVIFFFIAGHYFAARGARGPIATASAFVAIVGLADAAIIAGIAGRHAMFASALGFWFPLALIFAVTAMAGTVARMAPLPAPRAAR